MANVTSKVGLLHPQTPATRFLWALLGLGAASVLGLSCYLTPNPSGHGTHVQLGLPPCGFLWLTGLPCPACGLTTSFAWVAHGDLHASLRAHPLGLPLFLIVALAIPVCVVGAFRAWPLSEILRRVHADRVAYTLCGAAIVVWWTRLVAG